MKKIIMTLIVLSIAVPVTLMAGDKEEIIEQIMKSNAYLNKNKKQWLNILKRCIRIWSSGGLIHEISPAGRPDYYEKVNMSIKHIEVIVWYRESGCCHVLFGRVHEAEGVTSSQSLYDTRYTSVRQRGRWMENPCFSLVSDCGRIRYEPSQYELE